MVVSSVLLVADSRLAYCWVAQAASAGVPYSLGEVAVGSQADECRVVVGRPGALGVDVVGGLHDPRGAGPPGGDRVGGVLDARLRGTEGSLRIEIRLHEGQVSGLHQVDGPWHRVRPDPVVVEALARRFHGVARFEEQRVGVGEVALVEEVGQDTDDVVVVLGLIAVDSVVQLVAAPGDLGVDEPAAVGVIEGLIGDADPGDAGQLAVPEALHVREVLVEGTGGGQRGCTRPRVAAAEAVGSDHVVVIDRGVRSHCIRRRIERHQSRGSLGVGLNDVVRGVFHGDSAVDDDKRQHHREPPGRRTR